MIQAQNVTKQFQGIRALDGVTATIKPGAVFGLIGTNGAGKSTFLRLLSGVLRPDDGEITLEGQGIFENPAIKEKCFYVSDEQYFFANCTPLDMQAYYSKVYRRFDRAVFRTLTEKFELDPLRKINTFSKGMKKQISVICALAAQTEYILCDETFDGLDPVARQAVKSLMAAASADRGLTPVIASHSLRELEDICDHIGLLHRGGILLARELDALKSDIHKAQCVFAEPLSPADFPQISLVSWDTRGSLVTLIARGEKDAVLHALTERAPVFIEILPLTLEEIFISETEVAGYDFKNIFV